MSGTAAAICGGGWAGGTITASPHAVPTTSPGFLGWVLEYVQPLNTWFDELVGDPGQIDQVAASWGQVEKTFVSVADELVRAEAQLDTLEGRTIRTLQLRYEDLHPVARDAADWAAALAAAARLASSVSAGVRQAILDFLRQLERLVSSLFGFTLNPFKKADELRQLVAAVTDLAQSAQRLIQNMFDAFARLIELLQKLWPVVQSALVQLREVIAQMLPLIGLATFGPLGLIGGGVLRDALMDIGDVERCDQSDIDELKRLRDETDDPKLREALQKKIDAWEQANGVTHLGNLSDLVGVNGTTDAIGGADATAIDVKLVRAADGTEHWVVSLPSTQEWLDMFGDGTMSDGKNNIALMLDDPLLRTQYERAALQAMREAGMSPGDPVVFTGFSQGGIMAANLASDPNLPYTPIGVVTNGSPIDTFAVPSNIPVVAFQHANDPVAMLDGNAFGATGSNVQRVVLPPPAGALDVVSAHNNDQYVNSIDTYAGDISNEYAWMGGEVIDHQVFRAAKR